MRKAVLLSALFMFSNLAVGKYYVPERKEEPKREERRQAVKVESPLDVPVDVNVRDVDLAYLLSVLSSETGVPVSIREVPEKIKVSYFSLRKPLRVVLDEIASANDLWWEYTNEGVVMYRYKSAVYKLNFPLAQKAVKEDNQSAKLNITVNRSYWGKIEESLRNLLFDRNSKVTVNEMGYIFVYARPSELRAIEKAIQKMQRDVEREVPLEIKVFIVDEDSFREIGVEFAGKKGSFDFRSTPPMSPTPFLTLTLLGTEVEARLRALAESGKANILEHNSVVTLNGQPIVYAPQKVTRIVSSYRVAFIPGPGGQVGQPLPSLDVQTEDIPEGSYLLLVPQYVDEDKILIDLYYRLNRIEEIRQINLSLLPNTPPTAINLPQVSTYANLAQTVLQKGRSVALFSGSFTKEEIIKRGIPFLKDIPILGVLFGTHGKRTERFRLVIVITFAPNDEVKKGTT